MNLKIVIQEQQQILCSARYLQKITEVMKDILKNCVQKKLICEVKVQNGRKDKIMPVIITICF
jgi:hypothetical protein